MSNLACESSKTKKDVASSSSQVRDDLDQYKNALVGDCNGFISSSGNLSGIAIAFTNQDGSIDFNQVPFRFVDVPSEIVSGYQYKIQFYLWKEDSIGQIEDRSEPVEFIFQNRITGDFLSQTILTDYSKGQIESIIEQYALGISVSTFIKNYNLIFTGVEKDNKIYQAMAAALYKANSTTAVSTTSFLLPPFPADPNIYEALHTNQTLIQLHPNWPRKDSGNSESAFKSLLDGFCAEYMDPNPELILTN